MLSTSSDAIGDSQAARCQAMWMQSILLAWSDVFGGTASKDLEKREAESFLFSEGGQWAKSREIVASLAGIDPDALYEKAKAKLVGQSSTAEIA